MANFLSISPNQPKFLPSVCLIPGLDFSAIHMLQTLQVFRKAINLYFLDFKVAKYAVFSLTHSSNPLSNVNMFVSIFLPKILHNLPTAEFLVISAETACWEIERKWPNF